MGRKRVNLRLESNGLVIDFDIFYLDPEMEYSSC